ncbi:lysylphosphatidylglycerol synthase transmembrane domain-containing protein [Actinacidiphila alni]|uniref:lysylphosphatidylglycerol synthase transmembrane domain-containing protein n=1 Tax=Actinacidiphila alni TaxID=380248 RepID=UPI003453508A
MDQPEADAGPMAGSPVPPGGAPGVPARRRVRRLPWRTLAGLIPVALVGGWISRHWSVMETGGHDLLAANRGWLLAALAATGLGWVANAVARQGTVLEPLPPARLLATQFAASAAGQLAPAGIGAGAVNLRFLRTQGLSLIRSSAALALYSLAESVGRVMLLLVLLVLFPHALHLGGLVPDGGALLLFGLLAAAALAAAALTLALVRPLRRVVRDFLAAALTDARMLHARPARVLALWGGSFAFPALQAAGLAAVTLALGVPVPAAHAALAYLAATCLAAAVPTPGGIGSVDAALAVALVAAGSSTTAAASAVLGFRIVTVWVPLLPAALTLGALVRRKVL